MNILVISPHPDDETLGAGGTLIKQKKLGNNIYWLNITDMHIEDGWNPDLITHRQEQIKQIIDFYGFEGSYNLALPPSKLKQIDEGNIIHQIKKIYDEIRPEWIILPGQYDAHSDHHVVFNCCMAVAKTFRAPYIKRISTMEILSETDYGFQNATFIPNLFIDITDELEYKLNAMLIYDTELEQVPFPRSLDNIKALSSFRGGQCGCKYAEAFHIIKQIE